MNIKYIAALSSLALLTGCATGPLMTDAESCDLIGGAIDSMMFTLETFEGADHTEGMLSETDRYATALVSFFDSSLQ
jgi:hypothetical protein